MARLNSDGLVVESLKTTYGGTLRNDAGGFLGAYSIDLGVCPIIIVEVWDAYYGLELTWKKGH